MDLLKRMILAVTAGVLTIGSTPKEPLIDTEDVTRFYAVYEAAGRHPSAEQLQHDYIDSGSNGLRRLAKERPNVTGRAIFASIVKNPGMYEDARHCMATLPRVKERLRTVFHNLRDIYPEAQFPPVTIAISHGKPIAIADESGVIVDLEALCAVSWMNPNAEDRFVHIISHEYTHVQQALAEPVAFNNPEPTVLEESLIEGAAEFMAELTSGESGEVAYASFATRTAGHEREIDEAFIAAENDTDLSRWLDNSTMTKPGDLGYWVGYRIVKSYYEHAATKRLAVRDIIRMSDPKAFLAASGWHPGIHIAIPRATR